MIYIYTLIFILLSTGRTYGSYRKIVLIKPESIIFKIKTFFFELFLSKLVIAVPILYSFIHSFNKYFTASTFPIVFC